MTRDAQATKRYFDEAYIALKREGFQINQMDNGHLEVRLDGQPLCEVNEIGGIIYKYENITTPEREAAKDKAFQIICRTSEYMRQMEVAPVLKADGLEEKYKLLAEFNGTVLAGMHSKIGVVFTTWDRTPDGEGLSHGHYFMEDYEGAKQDFATRSCLIPEQQLFSPEQMVEIYRCCADTLDAGFDLTYDQDKRIRSVQEQIERCMPDIMEQIHEQDQHTVEPHSQEQTM